jgi:uncharacterized protein YkwD
MPHRHVALVVSLVAAFSLATTSAHAACANAGRAVTKTRITSASRATLCELNRIRRAHHLRAFRSNAKLARAARAHSLGMVRRRFFAHGAFVSRLRSYFLGAGSFLVGENIAWGSGAASAPRGIVRRWMNSPPHRRNILNGRFREIGVGIAAGTPYGGRGGTYTTDFGRRG